MRRSILQNLRSVLEVYPSFYEKHFKHDATFLKEDLLSIPIRWEGSYLHFELKKIGCSSSIRGRRHQKWLPLFDKKSLPPLHKEEHSEQEFVNEVSLPPPQSQLEKADQGGTWSEVSSSLSKVRHLMKGKTFKSVFFLQNPITWKREDINKSVFQLLNLWAAAKREDIKIVSSSSSKP